MGSTAYPDGSGPSVSHRSTKNKPKEKLKAVLLFHVIDTVLMPK